MVGIYAIVDEFYGLILKKIELGELATVFQNAKQKPSFSQVQESHIVQAVKLFSSDDLERDLNEMPKIDYTLYTNESLGIELFHSGISHKNIEDILISLQQADRLCSWYKSEDSKKVCGRIPSENEVVSHIILPIFLGLGWSHQQIAVEWNKVDVAFFKKTPTIEENCVMVLEAKGHGKPLGRVLEQPLGYVKKLVLGNVVYILVTDGENLFVYDKKESERSSNPKPVGYINIRSLQKEYVLPKNTNPVDTLVKLQPNLV